MQTMKKVPHWKNHIEYRLQRKFHIERIMLNADCEESSMLKQLNHNKDHMYTTVLLCVDFSETRQINREEFSKNWFFVFTAQLFTITFFIIIGRHWRTTKLWRMTVPWRTTNHWRMTVPWRTTNHWMTVPWRTTICLISSNCNFRANVASLYSCISRCISLVNSSVLFLSDADNVVASGSSISYFDLFIVHDELNGE